jgi:hypothetical protein
MIDARRYHSIYAPATTQNHKGRPGLFCFYLSDGWKPADGSYRIEVEAVDTSDNHADARLDFSVENGSV